MLKWIGPGHPRRYARKRDLPAHCRHLGVRVLFPFEIAWIMRDASGKVLFDVIGAEHWADTWDFYLRTKPYGGTTHVIGLRDLTTAESTPWAEAWRAAGHAAIMDRLALNLKQ